MKNPEIEILEAQVEFYKGMLDAFRTMFLDTLNSLETYFHDVGEEELKKDKHHLLLAVQGLKFNAMLLPHELPETA